MRKGKLKFTILSMSMLTVMAGAAVSPALVSIQANFSDVSPRLIQMILTIPGLFIMLTNFVFPAFSRKFNIKVLAIIGLILYTFGGTLGAFSNNIYVLLLTRVLLGIGVGFIMPLSTGLLAYYFDMKERQKLMGYSVAMNNFGGIVAMSLSGYLAAIAWYYSFSVYLLGLIVIVLVVLFLPKDKMGNSEIKIDISVIRKNAILFVSMFLMMVAFYAYITSFSIQSVTDGILQINQVGIVMSFQSVGALLLALVFGRLSKHIGGKIKYIGTILFIFSFMILLYSNSPIVYMFALLLMGAGLGLSMSYINSEAVKGIHKSLATSVMSIMTIFLYLGQFLSPFISGLIMKGINSSYTRFPYIVALVSVVLILILTICGEKKLIYRKEKVYD